MNIVVALERRQWLSMDQWKDSLLQRLCEDFTIEKMANNKIKTTLSAPVTELNSAMAVAFSCDGSYFASGHLTHNIVVGRTTPCIKFWKLLSGHDRTPWVLTFDLIQPHILYSGCLAGKVCKWNILNGSCLCSYNSSSSSPVNSIYPLPSHPDLLLVAVLCDLCLLSTADLSEMWRVKTESRKHILRLAVPHPSESKLLTAITNVNDERDDHIDPPTTYQVQLHSFYKDYPPVLVCTPSLGERLSEHEQVICHRAQIFSPHSIVLTDSYCICLAYDSLMLTGSHSVNVYSVLKDSYGECLHALPLERNKVVSLSLSPHWGHLLLGFAPQRSTYHYDSRSPRDLEIYRFHLGTKLYNDRESIQMKKIGSIPSLGTNVAVWMPLSSGHGYGVCFGSVRNGNGKVFFWRALETTDHTVPNAR